MSKRNPSGAIHPSVLLVAWGVVGMGLHRFWPLDLPGASLLQPLKFLLFTLGAAVFGWAMLELRRHETTVEHKNPTTALVTKGPYGVSRNPMYLGLVLVLAAVSVDWGSVWFLTLTVAFGGAVQWLTVAREEAYLEREFGEEYLHYKGTVRRWL